MKKKTLFLDIGGVLLTNGWDTRSREKAAQVFALDFNELNKRHALTFDTYEIGKLTLEEYIQRTVFYQPRSFSLEQYKAFMFEQSQPFTDMLELMKDLKKKKKLQIAALSNEGRELIEHRIEKFKLKEFVDFFVVSSFIHLRKPDLDIYKLALDLAQVKPEQAVYIDDREMLAEIGGSLGMHAIQHQSYEKTKELLEVLL
ncbi:MAG: HAD-IA family hydrolase [Candidatus Protochlamydia sp.]|nr:HAD-IA family hydrolase [Candidatus Protochlamydia sp.]